MKIKKNVKQNLIISALSFMLLLMFSIISIQLLGIHTHSEELHIIMQPSEIEYNSNDPYQIRIIRMHKIISSHIILIINAVNNPNYGFVISYPDQNRIFSDVNTIKTLWNKSGIKIDLYGGGPQLFIPAARFTGGR